MGLSRGEADVGGTQLGRAERSIGVALAALAGISAGAWIWQAADARPVAWAGLTIDRLSASLALLVSGIGLVTYRFSIRYLDGDTNRGLFLRRLGFAVGMAFVLMLSSNLLLFFSAWLMTSLALHGLLTFDGSRAEARRPARKKFLISRLGDVALISAIVLIWRDGESLDLHAFLAEVARTGGVDATAIALLLVVAALTKSAQFPFHSWLPETMESPTPVSALMHAGIINAGGVLLIRFAPLIARTPEALLLLAVVGTITSALGMMAMWSQVKVKRTLAWSTVSQMGFMMIQCGLAAFPAAILHILGHGLYKAWSFLRAGQLPPATACRPALSTGRTLRLVGMGVAASIPFFVLAAWLTGFNPTHSPGELALAAIVAMAMGQIWVGLLGASPRLGVAQVAGAIGLTAAATLALSTLYVGAGAFWGPTLGNPPVPSGPLAWLAAAFPVIGFGALVVLHARLPTLARSPRARAFQVHALHGFYFGAIADRLVDRVWSVLSLGKVKHA